MSDEIDRLTVVWDANFSKLNEKLDKAIRSHYGAADKITKKLDEVDSRWDRLFGKTDPGKALDRIFDSSRLKILDTGVARIGLVGGALEELGPLGLTAAAGLAAVFGAFAGARDAVKFASEIGDQAKNLHVTTDALQEYRFANQEAGGTLAGTDEALGTFSQTLGRAEAGVKKALVPFRELFGKNFSAENVKNLGGVQGAIEAITKAIEKLPTQQQDAVLGQFGLTGLSPALESGLTKFRELQAEAKSLGLVMDAEIIQRGTLLQHQFDVTSEIIEKQLKSALVDLGPVLLDLLKFAATLARDAADIADSFKSIDKRRSQGVADDFALQQQKARGALLPAARDVASQKAAADVRELLRRNFGSGAPGKPPATPPSGLHDLTEGKRDDTAQRNDEAERALETADRARIEAEKGLTENLTARRDFEAEALDAQAKAETADLQKKIDAINSDDGDHNKEAQIAKLKAAQADIEAARVAKQDLNFRQAGFALADQQIAVRKAEVDALLDELQAQADMASTAKERVTIERRILAIRQQFEKDLANDKIDRDLITNSITDDQAARQRKALDTRQSAARTGFATANLDPLQQFEKSVQDTDTLIKTEAVDAFKALSESIGESASKALGFTGILGQFVSKLISIELEKNGASLLSTVAHLIPGFASGGVVPGGLTLVGERGPEILNLPAGSRITSNADVRAMANAQVGGGSGFGGSQVNLFDLRGAVMTADILAQVNAISARNAIASVQAARTLTRSDLTRRARRAL